MEVILVRHTSVDVPKGTCYGQTDVPVCDTFEQEAEETRKSLEQYLFDLQSNSVATRQSRCEHRSALTAPSFDKVFSSPLTRARKLAAYCGYPDAVLDDRLMEMDMGEWEMQLYNEIQDPHLQEWYDDYMHLPTTGGEGFPDLYRRVAGFLEELRDKDYHRVGIFAHGGVLISAGIYAGLFSKENAWDYLVPFGGIQRIRI